MPRQSIEQLRRPKKRHRVDLRTDDPDGLIKFESLPSCVLEDERRARALESYLKDIPGGRKHRHAVGQLATFLRDDVPAGSAQLSAASRVLMREWRIGIGGWLWSMVAPLNTDEWVFFTLVLPSWWIKSRKLKNVRAKRLMERLRVALHRAGSAKATGWLYAMIHGEFDGDTKGFCIHVHGLATGGMIKVLRALREQPQFKSNKFDVIKHPEVGIARKLKIDKPWGSLPALITYTSKSFWPQQNSKIRADGKRRRHGPKQRISGKHFVRHLLWLHAQPVKHQVLLVHLSVMNGALVAVKRGDSSAN